MRYSIKETCSCGATLIFQEIVSKSYEKQHSYAQSKFHDFHKNRTTTQKIQLQLPSEVEL